MPDKTIEEMKQELVQAKYWIGLDTDDYDYRSYAETPDEWQFYSHWYRQPTMRLRDEDMAKSEADVIPIAYAHLKAQEELEALRAFAKRVKDIPIEILGASVAVNELEGLVHAAYDLIGEPFSKDDAPPF